LSGAIDCADDSNKQQDQVIKRVFWISLVAVAYLGARDWETRPIEHSPGVLVPQMPIQRDSKASQFKIEDYLVTRRASFEIRARVLSTETYFIGRESDLSPIDLALGWGPMSDQSILDLIEISQSARWYRTRWDQPLPIGDNVIIRSSSNMHMIPSAKKVKSVLKNLRKGDLVNIRGSLVDVDHESGWFWRTSLSREDTGAGACEIVYVESIVVE
jgi:hypothetical protein